jgi:hypothetical protein
MTTETIRNIHLEESLYDGIKYYVLASKGDPYGGIPRVVQMLKDICMELGLPGPEL